MPKKTIDDYSQNEFEIYYRDIEAEAQKAKNANQKEAADFQKVLGITDEQWRNQDIFGIHKKHGTGFGRGIVQLYAVLGEMLVYKNRGEDYDLKRLCSPAENTDEFNQEVRNALADLSNMDKKEFAKTYKSLVDELTDMAKDEYLSTENMTEEERHEYMRPFKNLILGIQDSYVQEFIKADWDGPVQLLDQEAQDSTARTAAILRALSQYSKVDTLVYSSSSEALMDIEEVQPFHLLPNAAIKNHTAGMMDYLKRLDENPDRATLSNLELGLATFFDTSVYSDLVNVDSHNRPEYGLLSKLSTNERKVLFMDKSLTSRFHKEGDNLFFDNIDLKIHTTQKKIDGNSEDVMSLKAAISDALEVRKTAHHTYWRNQFIHKSQKAAGLLALPTFAAGVNVMSTNAQTATSLFRNSQQWDDFNISAHTTNQLTEAVNRLMIAQAEAEKKHPGAQASMQISNLDPFARVFVEQYIEEIDPGRDHWKDGGKVNVTELQTFMQMSLEETRQYAAAYSKYKLGDNPAEGRRADGKRLNSDDRRKLEVVDYFLNTKKAQVAQEKTDNRTRNNQIKKSNISVLQ